MALRTLNVRFGLPAETIKDSSKLYPTIPTELIKSCRKSPGHLGKMPLDQQTQLIASAYVMCKATKQAMSPHFGSVVNPNGVMFGDSGFRPLNSFKTT